MFPRFLGIGAQKAGTSWLHAMLSTHEEIWLPHLKELHYFDRKFPIGNSGSLAPNPQSGILARQVSSRMRRIDFAKMKELLQIGHWRELTWEFRYLFGDWSDEWYASLFATAGGRLAGEITPAYSCLGETAIPHVHSLMPDAKLILLLREPIDRAWSHARMDLAGATGRDHRVVEVELYVAHFSASACRLRGDYRGTINRRLTTFPGEQLFLGYCDEIKSSPENLLTRIFRFLGVSADARRVPRNARARVNPGINAVIPPHLSRLLAAIYMEGLRELAQRYGSYPQHWLERCERLMGRADVSR